VDIGGNVWLDVYPARLESQPNMGLQAVLRHVSGNTDICSPLGDRANLGEEMGTQLIYLTGVVGGDAG
jgi:hypothetical protein